MKKSEDYKKIARLFNDWINMEALQKSPNTIVSYKKSLKIFISDFLIGYKAMSSKSFLSSVVFSRQTILEWSSWLLSVKNNSIQTRNLRISNLISFIKYMSTIDLQYETYYIGAADIKLKRQAPKRIAALSSKAMEAVINAPDITTRKGYRDHVLLAFMYATAGRINEVLSVRIKDLNLRIINNGNSYVNFMGKGRKRRAMLLLNPIVEQIHKYILLFHGGTPNENDFLFYTMCHGQKSKMSQKNVALLLKKYAKIAHEECSEVPLSLHSHQFRHTRATIWLKEKHKLPTVSLLLGHEHVDTTMRYLDITEDMIAEAARETRSDAANTIQPLWDNDTDLSSYFNFT